MNKLMKNIGLFDHAGQEKKLKRNILNISQESFPHTTKNKGRRRNIFKEGATSFDYSYKTLWKSPEYHIFNGKTGLDRTSIYIERNDNQKFDLVEGVERYPPRLQKFADRVPIASERYPPNEQRFLNINKAPSCLSMNKHMRNIFFGKQTKRNLKETLFPFEGYKVDYDNYVKSKDKTMKNLNSVAIQMSRSAGRVSYRSHIPKKTVVGESCDP